MPRFESRPDRRGLTPIEKQRELEREEKRKEESKIEVGEKLDEKMTKYLIFIGLIASQFFTECSNELSRKSGEPEFSNGKRVNCIQLTDKNCPPINLTKEFSYGWTNLKISIPEFWEVKGMVGEEYGFQFYSSDSLMLQIIPEANFGPQEVFDKEREVLETEIKLDRGEVVEHQINDQYQVYLYSIVSDENDILSSASFYCLLYDFKNEHTLFISGPVYKGESSYAYCVFIDIVEQITGGFESRPDRRG